MSDPERVAEAIRKLEEIKTHSSPPHKTVEETSKAVSRRIKKLECHATIGDIPESEINTRHHQIKQAYRQLEGSLQAFIEASYRHHKTTIKIERHQI